MKFTVHVQGAPYSHQSNLSALRFCQALLEQDHSILRVFFSGEGVHTATQLAVPPQDELDQYHLWQSLAEEHHVELVVCVAACLKRGLLNEGEAKRYNKSHHNIHPAFILSGLGQLVEAGLESDRLITFGQ